MNIQIPELCLVVLVGPSGSGKSTFARRHFGPTEIVSSDACRALVSDDENDQSATSAAFEVLHFVTGKRLENRRLTVIDATSVTPESRKSLIELAKAHDVLPVAIVLDLSTKVCEARNRERADRDLAARVVRAQHTNLRKSLRGMRREGFNRVHVLTSPDEVDAVTIERTRLWTDRRDDHGPFDIVGDVHGCHDELVALLGALGYLPEGGGFRHPEGRRAIFVGDLVDRGPASPAVLRTAMSMVASGAALCVPGNHEVKLLKKLNGQEVKLTHGLAETMEQLEREAPELREQARTFIDGLVSHYVLDGGRLVVAHAGLSEKLQGRASSRVRQFALYGDTTGETDEFGLPVRYPWATEYRGPAMVVYGHTPTPEAMWVNRTICIDTGCVFGGKLTALRYPEKEIVSVPARRTYYEPLRPMLAADGPQHDRADDVLDFADVGGKRIVETRVRHSVTLRAEDAVAALEVMSRFAADPHWLVYLPPTMSPVETCPEGEWLERPEEAFDYYARAGVSQVVCEEKHMGSRAVVVVCRDEAAARRRFGAADGRAGIVYSRTGRPFFADAALETALLGRVRGALDRAGFWERFGTDWFVLDAELMPWSLKAEELLRTQYAAVGAAGGAALAAVTDALRRTGERGAELLARFETRRDAVARYGEAWARYCWTATDIDALRLAPFHLLASEGKVHTDRPHDWHMDTLAELAGHDPVLVATPYRVVDLSDAAARADASAWWHALTAAGGEGMVVKPLSWLAYDRRGLVQPAVKVRGREYLRIIYGPEYTEHLPRLRERGLSGKRSLALRELALGLEALHRFVDREPLYRVHECVFGVLALETEPVDPRL
jgi:protein phosphatase